MSSSGTWGLFEVFGVEMEYMIVDRTTLAVRPIADELLKGMAGEYVQTVERDKFAWSNELVCHVIELKTNGPAPSLQGLADGFHEEIRFIHQRLAADNAMLLGGGSHPLFDPDRETRLWPHGDREIYAQYDRIFGCRGHGWSNLQSVHLNLPFADDEEFGRLHAAIRLVLPLIPALAASTPMLDGRITGYMDTRLETYRHNQARIPSIAGRIIPERVFTEEDYRRRIFAQIEAEIRPHDPDEVLESVFLNSRGAIARFDRNAIEIRLIDIQEAPVADLAVLELVVAVVRMLTEGSTIPLQLQQQWPEDLLADILLDVIREGDRAQIRDADYLAAFGYPGRRATAAQLCRYLAEKLAASFSETATGALRHVLANGPLSRRLLGHLGTSPDPARVTSVYSGLGRCLIENRQLP
ncbi:MAG: glutamate-cysteine ligase family protein [Gammaproteobacteria bacterium]